MSFVNIYSEAITSFVLNQLDTALQLLKQSESLIVTQQDQLNYYKLLLNIHQKNNNPTACYHVCDCVVFSNLDWNVRNEFLNMQSSYVMPLPFIRKIKFAIPTPHPYHVSSPSLVTTNDGYQCNFRAVNYVYTTEGQYKSKDDDGIVRTRNYHSQVDKQFNISNMWEMQESENFDVYPCHVMGMEDVRLFGPNYLFCTRLDATSTHEPKMCFGFYDNQLLTSLKVLDYNNMKTEKNWLPCYTNNDDCKVIYSFEPLVVYQLNLQTGSLTPWLNKKLPNANNLSSFRGSAVPIRYRDGWLMTVHQVYYHQKRKYMHRFVWMSNDFNDIKISPMFYFDKLGVEFNLGVATHDDGLIITYSVDDKDGKLMIISYQQLDSMLQL